MFKRIFSLALTLIMCLAPYPARAADNYADAELARAVALGLGVYRADNPAVTFTQFFGMLDNAVKIIDETKADTWEKTPELQAAGNSNKEMTRSDGMFAVFCAAEIIGGDYARFNSDNWGDQWEKLGNNQGHTARNFQPDAEIFGEAYIRQTPKILFRPQDDYEDRYGDALIYSFARASHYSSQPIFNVDTANNSLRPEAKLLYTEALLAALRFCDSGASPGSPTNVAAPAWTSDRYPAAADRKILSDAEARKNTIMNSPSTVTVTGTKYYVSNSGNDSNDGKSPENAWATVAEVNAADLKPGDGVFFERGGTWRNVFLKARNGVTYSAYGGGEKPRLFGSPENGANPEYWTLVPGTENVWQYHIKMNEVGLILVNNNENLTEKYIAYWDIPQQKYVASLDLKTPFDLKMLENRQFFSEIDLKGLQGGQAALSGEAALEMADDVKNAQNGESMFITHIKRDGNLYFRCDEGNPGSVYQSIEFAMTTRSDEASGDGTYIGGAVIMPDGGAENIIFDNLSIKYSEGGIVLRKGSVLQNCEFAFIGGTVLAYTPPEKLDYKPEKMRDIVWTDDGVAISFGTSDVTVKDNYVHDIVANAYNIEQMLDGVYKNIRINGNLFERCGTGSTLTNFFPNDNPNTVRFQDVFIDNNYFLYNGYFAELTINVFWPMHKFEFFHPEQYKNINYSNNVFYLSKGSLFDLSAGASLDGFNFSGNTYAQHNGGVILRDDVNNRRLFYDGNAEQTIRELTGDTNAAVLPLSFAPQIQPAQTSTPQSGANIGGNEPVDKPFNIDAQNFLNGLPAEARKEITWTRKSVNGIEFIEAYRDNGKQKPLMFVIHGGGGGKEQTMWDLDMYAHEGFYAVAMDAAAHGESDRGPLMNIDAWIETVGYIDTLIDHYGTGEQADAEHFGVAGNSMGGSITFLYGVIGKHTPKVLLPEIGSADYTQIMNGRVNGITDRGQIRGEEKVSAALTEKAKELSAVSNVEKFVNIPMWANFGSEDYENGIEGSREFIKLLKDAGGKIQELTVIEGGGHGGFDDSVYAGRIEYIKKAFE